MMEYLSGAASCGCRETFPPARLDQQNAGRHIPQADGAFDIGIEPAGGDIGHIQAALPIMRHFLADRTMRSKSGSPRLIESRLLATPTDDQWLRRSDVRELTEMGLPFKVGVPPSSTVQSSSRIGS